MYGVRVADDFAEADTEKGIRAAITTLIEDNLAAGTDARRCLFPTVFYDGRFSVALCTMAHKLAVETIQGATP